MNVKLTEINVTPRELLALKARGEITEPPMTSDEITVCLQRHQIMDEYKSLSTVVEKLNGMVALYNKHYHYEYMKLTNNIIVCYKTKRDRCGDTNYTTKKFYEVTV